jgi:peptide/nickel transport system substrate-binding protein
MFDNRSRLPLALLLLCLAVLALASCNADSASDQAAEQVGEEAPETTQGEEAVPPATPEETMAESEEASEDAAAEPEDGEPLIVLLDNDEGPITPANFNTFIGYWLVGYVYDPLFARAPDLSIVPALATEATPSEDGLTWNVTLRDDVTWHDGEPFTAEDVVFSYDFLKAAGRAPNLAAVETVEAQGDHELTITLSEPAPFFLSEGLAGYYILPEHIWRDQEPVSGELSQFQGQIGTGAYVLEEIVPGESYTFRANPDYFRGEPSVDSIIAKIVKDRTQQFNQLRTGAADAVLSSVPPAQVEQLKDSEEITLANGSDFFNYVFYMNGSRPPFDQVEVRQAIAKAIDTRALVDIVFLGEGVELPLSWYHPDLPWAADIPHEYDPAGAMELLEAAGLVDSDGDGIREFEGDSASYEILCDVNNPVEIRATELIAGWLEDVGIEASQNCLDIDTSVTLIWPNFVAVPDPDYDMAIWGWSSGVQFQRGFLRGLLDGDFGGIGWANLTGIADPELDELMAEYVSNPDPARTEELAQQIQERIAENLPLIALMSPSGNFGYRTSEHDGWTYMRGTGIAPVWSYLPEEAG